MTVKDFVQRHPDSTLNLMTPAGYVTLTPERSKNLLQGKPIQAHAGTTEAQLAIPAEHLLHQELFQLNPHITIPHCFSGITDDYVNSQEVKRLETTNFSYCTLLSKDFSGVCFDGADFQYAKLHDMNFQNTVFLNCDFSKTKLTDCNLDGAVMVHCQCFDALLENCSTSGMRMKGCKIEAMEVYGSELSDIQMDDMTRKSIPAPMDLDNATVGELLQRCISQSELELMGAKHVLWLHGEGGEQADFSHCRLVDLNMSHMNFNHANFDGAVLEGVDLSGAYLCHSMFGGAKFTECNLSGVYAEDADFEFAAVDHCDLRMGTYTNSSLCCMEITESDLSGMNVRNCCVENSQIQEYAELLYDYHTVYLSESDWMKDQRSELQGMGGME